jgi:hypothetical protein
LSSGEAVLVWVCGIFWICAIAYLSFDNLFGKMKTEEHVGEEKKKEDMFVRKAQEYLYKINELGRI